MPLSEERLIGVALAILACLWALSACVAGSTADDPTVAAPFAVGERVVLEMSADSGRITARADRVTLDRDLGAIGMDGDASVEIDGLSGISARCDRLLVKADGPVLEMEGRVRAAFRPASGGPDAGP